MEGPCEWPKSRGETPTETLRDDPEMIEANNCRCPSKGIVRHSADDIDIDPDAWVLRRQIGNYSHVREPEMQIMMKGWRTFTRENPGLGGTWGTPGEIGWGGGGDRPSPRARRVTNGGHPSCAPRSQTTRAQG
jgi:hypothetical protein